jgi:hypothetical protein
MYLIEPLPVLPATGRTLVDEGLRELLALRGVTPRVVATDERPGLRRGVPAEELDRGALLLVVVLDAGVVAVHEPGHARELLATERAHDVGLAEPGGEVARQHGGLVDLEIEAREVGRDGAVGRRIPRSVDLAEVDRGVGLRRVDGRLGLVEPDGDDRVAALVDEALDVRGVV